MKLWPAEHDDPNVGGFVVELPSGTQRQVFWKSRAPIQPTVDAAKLYASNLIESLSKEAKFDDIERTNWPSAVAAIQKIIDDFNQRLLERHRQSDLRGLTH